MKTCKDCDEYSEAEYLGKNNKILTKHYCKHFKQELKSLKVCEEFNTQGFFFYASLSSGILAMACFFTALVSFLGNKKEGLVWIIVSGILFLFISGGFFWKESISHSQRPAGSGNLRLRTAKRLHFWAYIQSGKLEHQPSFG